jgi:AAA domain
MSDWRSKIVQQPKPMPPRIVVTGPPGIGKSTLAAQISRCVMLDADKGADELRNVSRIPLPKTWQDTIALIRDVAASPGDMRAFAIDTVDPLEDLAETFVVERENAKGSKMTSIGDFGFGAGYEALATEWRLFLAELDQVRAKGVIVLLLGHTMVRTAQDPTLGEYDEYTAQLQKKTWAATLRWADLVGFANFDAARLEKEKRAIVTENRVLHTQRGTGFMAKNRYGMPVKIPFTWGAIEAAIGRSQHTAEDVSLRINELVTKINLPEVTAKARQYIADAKGDVVKLLGIEEGLVLKLASMRTQVFAIPPQIAAVQPTYDVITAPAPPAPPAPPPAPNAPTAPIAPEPPTVREVYTAADVILRIEALAKDPIWGAQQPEIEAKARGFLAAAKLEIPQLLGIEQALQAKRKAVQDAVAANGARP